jgi:phosphatidylglycerol:prolipoprotein diacylglycerol transferase
VYGGIATGIVAAFLYARYKRVPFLRWTDIVAPGLFTMQAIARWGNFFNQELYGSATTLPWGIPIECQYRVQDYLCANPPTATDLAMRFHPLFLYESVSGVLGALTLIWVGYHLRKRLRPGDLFLVFLIWYGVVRFALEPLRHANWTFDGLPVAQIVSLLFIVPASIILVWRHRPNHPDDDPPTFPALATWGAPGRAVDFEEVPDTTGPAGDADATEPAGPADVTEGDLAEPAAPTGAAEPSEPTA